MSEGEKQESASRGVTRREFLKRAAQWGGALLAGSLGISACSPAQQQERLSPFATSVTVEPTTKLVPSPTAEPKVEPTRFLSEEELRKVNIRIIQTPNTTLKLEDGIFDFPLFKDAKEGRIKEVAIVLVEHPAMSWAASEKLPEDARLVWQAATSHPSERDDKYWENKKKEVQQELEYWEALVRKEQEQVEEAKNPTLKALDEESLKRDKNLLSYFQEAEHAFSQGKEKAIQAEEQWGRGYPSEVFGGQIIRLDTEYDYPQASRIQKLFQEYPATAKRFAILKKEHPELNGKVFIYITVGGDFKPKPTQSYPNPKYFMEIPKGSGDNIRYLLERTAGANLRHELGHYKTGSSSADEYEADTKMFESFDRAIKEKSQGKRGTHPFHFFTAEGETITQRQQDNQEQVA